MSDNTLPKPVSPLASQTKTQLDNQTMPPSAMISPPVVKSDTALGSNGEVVVNANDGVVLNTTSEGGLNLPMPSISPGKPAPNPGIVESPNFAGNIGDDVGGGGASGGVSSSGSGGGGHKNHGGNNLADQTIFAKVKQSPFRFLPWVVGGLILVWLIIFVLGKVLGNKNTTAEVVPPTESTTKATAPVKEVNLTYWGLWEASAVLDEVLRQFEKDNPGLKVSYIKQSHQDYRERLQGAITSGNGPDVFRYHAAWVPMLSAELAPMPQTVMGMAEYTQTFYPSAAKLLQFNGQLVGIPLMYDGLALYYNKELLAAANAQPPSSWAEVKTLAAQLTVRDGAEIKRGGMAIGNASNVEHFADILGLLMLQNGVDLTDPTSKAAQDALIFYTNFIVKDKVWSDDLPSSTVAFARGDVAMMLAPSWRAHEVQTINPDLKFGIVPSPTLGDEKIYWASFWAEGVSVKSLHTKEAWQLIKYLGSKEVLQKLYSNASQVRSFGEIYPRVDMADMLASDELVEPFLQSAPQAQGWYLSSFTHDNGINDLLIKYYQDAVNQILSGQSVTDALVLVNQGTKQVLQQYSVK